MEVTGFTLKLPSFHSLSLSESIKETPTLLYLIERKIGVSSHKKISYNGEIVEKSTTQWENKVENLEKCHH